MPQQDDEKLYFDVGTRFNMRDNNARWLHRGDVVMLIGSVQNYENALDYMLSNPSNIASGYSSVVKVSNVAKIITDYGDGYCAVTMPAVEIRIDQSRAPTIALFGQTSTAATEFAMPDTLLLDRVEDEEERGQNLYDWRSPATGEPYRMLLERMSDKCRTLGILPLTGTSATLASTMNLILGTMTELGIMWMEWLGLLESTMVTINMNPHNLRQTYRDRVRDTYTWMFMPAVEREGTDESDTVRTVQLPERSDSNERLLNASRFWTNYFLTRRDENERVAEWIVRNAPIAYENGT